MTLKKILIVDDEPLTCQLIAKMLKLQGYPSIVLLDAHQVLEVATAEQPALIIMDYHLGVSYGLEVLQALKANPDTRHIPVIVTSGMDRRKQVLEAGAHEFLLKPFDWKEIVNIITRFLEEVSQPK